MRKKILVEWCCESQSKLGEEFMLQGGYVWRLGLPENDMSREENRDKVERHVKEWRRQGFIVFLWFSLPCTPWCPWQRINQYNGFRFAETLEEYRRYSRKMVSLVRKTLEGLEGWCIPAAFEWPQRSEGWKIKQRERFTKHFQSLYFSTDAVMAFATIKECLFVSHGGCNQIGRNCHLLLISSAKEDI